MFYFAMRASGVPAEVQSKILYAAVLLGLWCNEPCPTCAFVTAPERDAEGRLLTPPSVGTSDAEQIKQWVEGEIPSLD